MPQKISLVTQTVGVLKENISSGFWSGELPGEHELCAQLRVSRVTLRKAMDELERGGWTKATQGKRRVIVKRPRHSPTASNRVILLTKSPLYSLAPFTLYWMDYLRDHLSETGYHLEIHTGQAAFSFNSERSLAQMEKQFRPAGWILYRSNEQMQHWFSRQSLPCVIAGSPHPNIKLPSVDIDYRAACRHAVGQFIVRKHKHLVFLNPESGAAGDLESEQGFLEAANAATSKEIHAVVVRHDGTVSGIRDKVDALLARPNRSTAFLVSRPAFVLTALSHLWDRNVRLPRDMALISRDDDSFLESLTPTVARYSSNPSHYARKLSRLVVEMVRGAALTCSEARITPTFIAGKTLG